MTSRAALRRVAAFYWNGVFAKFLVAGGLAAVANFAARPVLEPEVGFGPAVALAYLVGVATAFTLNRIFVFPASGKSLRIEMGWFFTFNALAFPVVVGGSMLLRAFVFGLFLKPALAEAAAHGCAILVPVVFNFAAHRLVTFRSA
jgi:putative flippase GtrA